MRIFGFIFIFILMTTAIFIGQNFTMESYDPSLEVNAPQKPSLDDRGEGFSNYLPSGVAPGTSGDEAAKRFATRGGEVLFEQLIHNSGAGRSLRDVEKGLEFKSGEEGNPKGEIENGKHPGRSEPVKFNVLTANGKSGVEYGEVKCNYNVHNGKVSMELGNVILEKDSKTDQSGVKMNFNW
jgi:hypothetical protein